MNPLNIIALISVILVAAGCAANKPLTYDTERSKALNIVKAANMEYGLRDVEVPRDTVSDIRNSVGYGLAYGWSGYNAPTAGGLSASGTAGMNVLAWALQGKSPSARNSIIAWMPEDVGGSSKQDAFEKMADIIIDATEKAAKDLNYSPHAMIAGNGKDKRGLGIRLTNDNSQNCKSLPDNKPSSCIVIYKVRDPQKIDHTAPFVGKGSTWFFSPVENAYTAPEFLDNKTFDFNQMDLLIAVSKHLPSWVYIYLAPGEVRMSETDKLKVPMILNKGEPHYFIKVKDSLAFNYP